MADVQPVIDDKSARLLDYREAMKKTRLLIACARNRPSQLCEIPEGFDPALIISPFDRTFLVYYPMTTALEFGAR